MSDVCGGGTWAMVCVAHSDGMSSRSSGASSIRSTKSIQKMEFLEPGRRSKGVDPFEK